MPAFPATMPRAELTATQVRALGPGFHWVAPNLYLLCVHKGRGSSILRYQSPGLGKQTDLSLGPCGLIDTPEAKRRALRHRVEILDGCCPLSERRATEAGRKSRAPTAKRLNGRL